jgi:Transposase DDE domain group 1
MENRLKEQKLDLNSDRTSTHTFEGNQLRLWLAAIAYILMKYGAREMFGQYGISKCHSRNYTYKVIKIRGCYYC